MTMRRRLGTVYVKSPAIRLKGWLTENFFKFIMAIICSIIWLCVMYAICVIIRFLGVDLAHFWDEGLKVSDVYNHPYCVPIKIIGTIVVIIYVFRDKTNKRG